MAYRIENRMGVRASSLRIWEIIADLESWPEWNPLYPRAAGRIALKGGVDLVEAVPGLPERQARVTVTDYTPEQQLIWQDRRGFLASSLRYFEIEKLTDESSILANGEIFSGWAGQRWGMKHRRALREAYETLNAAIKARAEA